MSRGKLSNLFFLIALITYPVVTEGNLNFFHVMFSIIACVCLIFSLVWSMRISKFSDSHVSRSSSKRHIVIREVLSRCGTGIVWALWLDTLLLYNMPYADAVFMLACLYFCLTGVLPFFEPNLVPSDLLVIYAESIVLVVVLLVLGGVPVLYAAMLPVSSCLGIVTCSLKTGLWSVRRRDKLITAKEREKILGTLVHEIRTPLTVMQAAENILLEEIPGPLTGKQKHFLQVIYANTQRLVLFSENMLSLLKMGKDWTPDLSCTIDVQKLVMDVIELVGPLLQSRRQEVRTSFPALLSRPYADPSWIQQVLLNLIHNASKYTDDGGYIIVSVTQDEKHIVITVSDNGHGVSDGKREILFADYYQDHPKNARTHDGFGLGLGIVRTIIRRHGGDVFISSASEHGTMVSFSLPAEAPS